MGSSQNKQKTFQEDTQIKFVFQKQGYDCGCLALPLDQKKEAVPIELPLKKIVYDINIVNGVAEVTLTQTYVNNGPKFLELQYRFPIHPNSCIHKFVAIFSKVRMEGVVKEKETARVEYSEAVKAGKRAALGEVDAESRDILTLQLGNLGPGEEVTVEIHFVEELSLSLNTFYQFTLLPRLTPRYLNSIPPADFLNAFRKNVSTINGKFEWDFRLSVRAARRITAFKSSTHSLIQEKKDDMGTEYNLTLAKGESFSKAFSFIYSTENFELPSYTLGRTDAGSSVMVSFIPKFCGLDLKDAEVAASKAEGFETDMDAARGEYVFLLDRSGSMGGEPIEKAKESLALFLKSLPIDTYFQVVSFGSGFEPMFGQSQKNGNETIAKALQIISHISADMGGTEIYAPLEGILKSEIISGYPKQIFLLTDGQVSDTERVIDLVRSNTRYSRVHTIGFGSDVSQALIIGCAEKGKGGHTFITNDEDPSQKIIQLLNQSLTPVISKVSLHYDKDVVESIVPNPERLPFILKGDVANFYVTFKGQLSSPTTLSLSYTDTLNDLPFKSTIEVSPQSRSECFVDKLGNFRRIKALEEAQASNGNLEDFLYYVKAVDKRQEIISLSTKHQILSRHTAFVCVQTELVDGRYQQMKAKGKEKVQVVAVEEKPAKMEQERVSSNFPLKMQLYRAPAWRGAAQRSASHSSDEAEECQMKQELAADYCAMPMMDDFLECALPEVSKCSANFLDECAVDFAACCQMAIKPEEEEEEEEEEKEKEKEKEKEEQDQCIKKGKRPGFGFESKEMVEEKISLKKEEAPSDQCFSVKQIVKMQLFEGYWSNLAIVEQIYGESATGEVAGLPEEDRTAAITFLVVAWIEKHHPQNEYTLIIRKAKNWLKKQKHFNELPSLFAAHLQ